MPSIRTAVCGLVLTFWFPIACNANASVLDLLNQFTSEADELSKVAIVKQLDWILRLQMAEQREAGNEVAEKISSQDREQVAAVLLSELEHAQSLELVSQMMLTWWRYEDQTKELAPETAEIVFRMLSDVRHNGKRLSPTTPRERAVAILSSCTASVTKDVVDLLSDPEILHRDAAVKILSARGYFEDHFDALAAMANSPEQRVRSSVARALAALKTNQNQAIRVAFSMLPNENSSDAVATTLATLASRATETQAASIQLALLRKLDRAKYVTYVYQDAIYKTMPRLSDKVQQAVVRKLIPHLSPQNHGIERAVAIAGANAKEALPYFLESFENASEVEKLKIAENLWRVEGNAERVLSVFLKAIESPNTTTRYYGFKGLRTLGSDAMPAERRLLELLDHEKSTVVRQSIRTLVVISVNSESSIKAIAELARSHSDPVVRKIAEKTSKSLLKPTSP